jgi:hypothetical protein
MNEFQIGMVNITGVIALVSVGMLFSAYCVYTAFYLLMHFKPFNKKVVDHALKKEFKGMSDYEFFKRSYEIAKLHKEANDGN